MGGGQRGLSHTCTMHQKCFPFCHEDIGGTSEIAEERQSETPYLKTIAGTWPKGKTGTTQEAFNNARTSLPHMREGPSAMFAQVGTLAYQGEDLAEASKWAHIITILSDVSTGLYPLIIASLALSLSTEYRTLRFLM